MPLVKVAARRALRVYGIDGRQITDHRALHLLHIIGCIYQDAKNKRSAKESEGECPGSLREQTALSVQANDKLTLVYRIVGAPLWTAPQITGAAILGEFVCGARLCERGLHIFFCGMSI